MDLLLIIAAILGGIVVLDILASAFGVDSRDSVGDDWGRPIRL